MDHTPKEVLRQARLHNKPFSAKSMHTFMSYEDSIVKLNRTLRALVVKGELGLIDSSPAIFYTRGTEAVYFGFPVALRSKEDVDRELACEEEQSEPVVAPPVEEPALPPPPSEKTVIAESEPEPHEIPSPEEDTQPSFEIENLVPDEDLLQVLKEAEESVVEDNKESAIAQVASVYKSNEVEPPSEAVADFIIEDVRETQSQDDNVDVDAEEVSEFPQVNQRFMHSGPIVKTVESKPEVVRRKKVPSPKPHVSIMQRRKSIRRRNAVPRSKQAAEPAKVEPQQPAPPQATQQKSSKISAELKDTLRKLVLSKLAASRSPKGVARSMSFTVFKRTTRRTLMGKSICWDTLVSPKGEFSTVDDFITYLGFNIMVTDNDKKLLVE